LQEHPRAKVVFSGDGQMRGKLEHRARKMGVHDAVRFLGHRSGPELVELFQMSQLVAVPSRNEPFGIVVLEGWSAGKPVVATHVGGPSEYLRHEVDGLKVFPNPESVAWGLREAFGDFERAEAMGAEGRKSVEREFRWERIAEQTLEVYDPDRTLRGPAEIETDTEVEPEPAETTPEAVAPAAEPLPVAAGTTPDPVTDLPEPAEAEARTAPDSEEDGVAEEPEPVEPVTLGVPVPEPGTNRPASRGGGSNGSEANGNNGHATEPASTSDAAEMEAEAQGPRIAVAAELSVEHSNGDGGPLGEALAACERALAGRGWRVQRRGTEMRIEGDLEPILGALRRCHRHVYQHGTLSLKTAIHTLHIQPPTRTHGTGGENGNGNGNGHDAKSHGGDNGKSSSSASPRKKTKAAETVA
jgi:uncharacterized protein YqgV (UPF0045/DUF77 family)